MIRRITSIRLRMRTRRSSDCCSTTRSPSAAKGGRSFRWFHAADRESVAGQLARTTAWAGRTRARVPNRGPDGSGSAGCRRRRCRFATNPAMSSASNASRTTSRNAERCRSRLRRPSGWPISAHGREPRPRDPQSSERHRQLHQRAATAARRRRPPAVSHHHGGSAPARWDHQRVPVVCAAATAPAGRVQRRWSSSRTARHPVRAERPARAERHAALELPADLPGCLPITPRCVRCCGT